LKKAGAFFCASALIALSYPQIGLSGATAPTLADANSINAETNYAPNDEKLRNKAVSPSAATSSKAVKSSSSAASAEVAYTATAYALRGRTASGSGVRRGIIAADPRVLPLGTRVQISAGAWSGTYVVADTGGVIKGRKIDIWVPSNSEARQFGRRKVKLTVLSRSR
jgi:3D (Asp-Asp-Asp) domain-containing protein